MALIDKIFGKKKTLSDLSKQELRREEILLTKQRDRLFKKIQDLSTNKQKIFQQGATQKSPELRNALAQARRPGNKRYHKKDARTVHAPPGAANRRRRRRRAPPGRDAPSSALAASA